MSAVDEMIEDGRAEGRMQAYAGLIKDGLLSVKEACFANAHDGRKICRRDGKSE